MSTITNHSQYTEVDYAYLQEKGYTDAEIKAIWDRDAELGKPPLDHFDAPGEYAEFGLIFRATVTDTISHEQIERYTFSAESIEQARERAWKRAGSYSGDVFVKIETISQ